MPHTSMQTHTQHACMEGCGRHYPSIYTLVPPHSNARAALFIHIYTYMLYISHTFTVTHAIPHSLLHTFSAHLHIPSRRTHPHTHHCLSHIHMCENACTEGPTICTQLHIHTLHFHTHACMQGPQILIHNHSLKHTQP